MIKSISFWVLAFVITIAAARYQRMTGPTYPLSGDYISQSGETLHYEFTRSHGGPGDQHILFDTGRTDISVRLKYKRFNMKEDYIAIPMAANGDGILSADLPHQPPAGKLEYFLEVTDSGKTFTLPADRTVVTRFKGDVPAAILIPHILFMFLAMLFSTRGGIEALSREGRSKNLTFATLALLIIGGLILGPIVQKFAFGELWTGIPYGWDLTDNKTLIAALAWALAAWKQAKASPNARYFVVAAALILFAVYMIPHSALGSELNYETGVITTG